MRLISGGAGVIFKGGGFYETDYKQKRGSEAAKFAGSEAKAAEGKPAETKSETKSDAKPAEGKSESKPKKDAPKKD